MSGVKGLAKVVLKLIKKRFLNVGPKATSTSTFEEWASKHEGLLEDWAAVFYAIDPNVPNTIALTNFPESDIVHLQSKTKDRVNKLLKKRLEALEKKKGPTGEKTLTKQQLEQLKTIYGGAQKEKEKEKEKAKPKSPPKEPSPKKVARDRIVHAIDSDTDSNVSGRRSDMESADMESDVEEEEKSDIMRLHEKARGLFISHERQEHEAASPKESKYAPVPRSNSKERSKSREPSKSKEREKEPEKPRSNSKKPRSNSKEKEQEKEKEKHFQVRSDQRHLSPIELLDESLGNDMFLKLMMHNVTEFLLWKMQRYDQIMKSRRPKLPEGPNENDSETVLIKSLRERLAKLENPQGTNAKVAELTPDEYFYIKCVQAKEEIKSALVFDSVTGTYRYKKTIAEYRAQVRKALNDPISGLAALGGDERKDLRDQWAQRITNLAVTSATFRRGNVVFWGGPGVGKTTAAKVFAFIMSQLGLYQGGYREVSVNSFKSTLVNGASIQSERAIVRNLDCIIIIDEAYQLKPTKDRDPDSLNQLVSLLETLQGLIIVILAGYKRQMQELFDYNDGLRRRFMSTYSLGNYSAHSLAKMFLRKIEADVPTMNDLQGHKIRLEYGADAKQTLEKELEKKELPNQAGDIDTLVGLFESRYANQIFYLDDTLVSGKLITEVFAQFRGNPLSVSTSPKKARQGGGRKNFVPSGLATMQTLLVPEPGSW